MQLQIPDRASLESSLANFGLAVGPRAGINKRTHDQKEWFCLRRYLQTLGVHDLVKFPVSLLKGERPDFLLASDDLLTGIEVTEATTEEYQRELTLSEKKGNGNNAELISEDGWIGDSAEREATTAILDAISAKLKSICSPSYGKADRYEILIYLNVRAFFTDSGKLLELLKLNLDQFSTERVRLQGVSVSAAIICGSQIIYGLPSVPQILSTTMRSSVD